MSTRTRARLLVAAGLLLITILTTCAEVAPPPGGEPDKSSPYILGSMPANGAAGVERGKRVEIVFSERVLSPDQTNPIFISPRPDKNPDINWKADHVVITFADSFAVNQTYQISLSSEITDLRRNKIDSSTTIVFTTGSALAEGRIAGTIIDNGAPQSGYAVALYDPADITNDLVFDSLYPDYLTSTNKDGQFAFGYLPDASYRAIAFKDINRDQRFNPAREAFAVPDRLVRLGRVAGLEDLTMVVSRQDTGSAEILSVTYTADRLMRIRLARPIPLDHLKESPNGLAIFHAGDTNQFAAAASMLETDLDKSATLTFYLPVIEENEFDIRLNYSPKEEPLVYDGFTVTFSPDPRPPVLLGVSPKPLPFFKDEVEIVAEFSEPIDTNLFTDNSFVLLENDSTRIPVSRSWRDHFHLELIPDSLGEGKRYRLAITEFEIADLAGNILGDSLQDFYFSTLSSDSLGSVRGTATTTITGEEKTPIVLTLAQVGGNKRTFETTVTGTTFTTNLPAGKYLLSGFLDRDRNGAHSPGSVMPFRYAETLDTYPDTIAVRARFETTGIDFVID